MDLSTIINPAEGAPQLGSSQNHVVLGPAEDASSLKREELEDRYFDLKDEVWRLRRNLL